MKNKLVIHPLNALGGAFTLALFIFLIFFIDTESLQTWVVNSGVWAPVTFVFLKILTIVVAPLSGALLYPLVGLLFGFWEGLFYAALGDFIGYTTAFFISRIFGQAFVLRFIAQNESGMVARIVDRMSTFKGFVSSCLALFFSPELLAYGAGLSRLPYWKFIIVLAPGSLLFTSILVGFGSSLAFASEGSTLITFAYLGIAGLCMLFGGWFFFRGVRPKQEDITS